MLSIFTPHSQRYWRVRAQNAERQWLLDRGGTFMQRYVGPMLNGMPGQHLGSESARQDARDGLALCHEGL